MRENDRVAGLFQHRAHHGPRNGLIVRDENLQGDHLQMVSQHSANLRAMRIRNGCLALMFFAVSTATAAAQTTAFVGGRVIDGTGRVVDNGTVIISGAKITAVGPASMPVPAGATRVDLKGKTILPGLVNAHGHVPATTGLRTDPASYTRENLTRQLRTYAMYGVTTVFSLGDDLAAGFELRNENATATERSKLFVAGPVISGDTAEAARAMAVKVAEMKPDLLKIRVDDNLGTTRKMPEAAWRATIAEAHARKLPIAVHI